MRGWASDHLKMESHFWKTLRADIDGKFSMAWISRL